MGFLSKILIFHDFFKKGLPTIIIRQSQSETLQIRSKNNTVVTRNISILAVAHEEVAIAKIPGFGALSIAAVQTKSTEPAEQQRKPRNGGQTWNCWKAGRAY